MAKRLLLLGCLLSSLLLAQEVNAVLSGTVLDSSGGVIAGANITIINTQTGVRISATSNDAGLYLSPPLEPGAYQLVAEHPGFKRRVLDSVTLNVGDRLNINLPLDIGNMAESIEVTAASETALGYATASVGKALDGQAVQQLPLTERNVLTLVGTQAGVQGPNIAGSTRVGLNISLDGVSILDNRTNFGLVTPLFTSVDRVGEVQVITSPADAEVGRGGGHIVIISRSGTNQLRASVFEQLRNTDLNANSFFNNFQGIPRNVLVRNQFGTGIDGPIIKNKTFFRFHIESQRLATETTVTQTVYTAAARQGLFRFFPGAQNANSVSLKPTVDPQGNPVEPASATGPLQTVSLYGLDPNRRTADPTGLAQAALALTPLPNNFTVGDGLNTAGYTWRQPQPFPRLQWDFKIDHYFTPSERLSVGYTHENNNNPNANQAQPFPTVPGGTITSWIRVFSLNMLSSLRPNLINEFHGGFHRPNQKYLAPWDPTCQCAPALPSAGSTSVGPGFLPKINGQPFQLGFSQVTSPYGTDNSDTNPIGPYARISPVYQYSDTISWLKGKHAIKFGGEVWFASSNGYNSFNVTPRVNSGNGGLGAPLNITTIAGIGANATLAQGMLNDLAGSVNSVTQAFNLTGRPAVFLAGLEKQRTWTTREFNWFAKDDFKVTQNLTLNLGVRYEYYSPIYDANGLTATVVGGSAGIFGISGTNFGAMFQPGLNQGSLTQMQLVGPKSPNPNTSLYNPDRNNFSPALGLAYRLPQTKWLGNRSMVFRLGYGWNYEKITIRHIDAAAGDQANVRLNDLYSTANPLNLTNVVLPLVPPYTPLQTDPVTDRTQTVHLMDPNLRNPYVQNWNVGIQAGLTASTTLQVSYIGSKGTRLMYAADLNEDNIFETGILNAFRITQSGGTSPLMNQLFQGLNVPGVGVVDGVNITGSAAVRQNTTMNTFLANNDVGGFANFLNTSNFLTNQIGGIPRRAGFPENWITVNPQFLSAIYTSNFGSSVYNSMVVQVDKHLSKGVNVSGNYTLSRATGDTEGNSTAEEIDNFRTWRNRSLNDRLLSFSIKHAIRGTGTWELPVGPSRALLGSSQGIFAKLVEHWQTGFVLTYNTGMPIAITASGDAFNQFGGATPVALAPIAGNMGSVTRVGNGVTYFPGYTLVADPQVQTFSSAFSSRSTLHAVVNSSGQMILENPVLGTLGNLDQRPIYGPNLFELDVNLVKTFRIRERYNFSLRADATSITNTPQFGNPNLSINSLNFGSITTAGGNRIVTLEARLSF